MTLVSWTDDRITELTRLLALGTSCSQIASEMGGTTRNAVIGKIHRLGLKSLHASGPRPKRLTEASAPRIRIRFRKPPTVAAPAPELFVVPLAPSRDNITITDLEPDECRFSIGGGEGGQPYFFCGHAKREGSSYCGHHACITIDQRATDRRGANRRAA